MAAFSERRGQPLTLHPGPWFQCSSHSSITKTFEVSSSDQQIPRFIAHYTKSLSSLLHIIYSPCRGKKRNQLCLTVRPGPASTHSNQSPNPILIQSLPFGEEPRGLLQCLSSEIPHISLLLTPPSIPPATTGAGTPK